MTIDTERLRLRTWTREDFDDYAELMNDREVTRFLGGNPLARFAAWRDWTGMIGHWTVRGFGLFAVEERATGKVIGRVGPWEPEGWPDLEIGWALRSDRWGRGYATEAAEASIEYAFTVLDRPHLISLIVPENLRSIRVAERVGETLEGTVLLPHVPDKQILQYGLFREDWERRRTSPFT